MSGVNCVSKAYVSNTAGYIRKKIIGINLTVYNGVLSTQVPHPGTGGCTVTPHKKSAAFQRRF